MARSYVLPLVCVILQIVSVSHLCADAATDGDISFTIMSYVPKEDFILMNCDCLDIANNVTVLQDSFGSCIDKWYSAATCPSGVEAKTFFCNFRYFVRDRVALTVTPKYANFMAWARWGPVKTFYQLTPSAVYGSTDFDSFSNTPTNKLNTISSWFTLYEGRGVTVIKDQPVGNGASF